MAKRKTELQKAQDEMAKLNRRIAEYQETNSRLAIDKRELERLERLAQDALAVGEHLRNSKRKQFVTIFHLHLDLARKTGYIDRVREEDGGGIPEPVQNPDPGEMINRYRDDLASATSDRQVGRVLDGMEDDVLDAVLGREDG